MQTILRPFKKILLYSAAVLLACSYPLSAVATTTETPSESTPVSQPATTSPALTESTEKPAEQVLKPEPKPVKPKPVYSYDATTGRWNTEDWRYDSASNTYKKVVKPAPVAPAETTKDSPTVSTEPTAQKTTPTQAPTTTNKTAATSSAVTDTAVTNAIYSLAKSGDADVLKNLKAGDATTGSAEAAATIINNVNSSLTSSANKEAASFVSNVVGDVNGDIMLQPMLLKAMLEAGASNSHTTNATNNTTLQNDLTLNAISGDATVAKNTSAGNATTGSANTVANVMNLLNSMIATNQSFVGTINIYGNLNGDILIAPDFIPQLISDNATTSKQSNASTIVDAKDTQSIVNNVALAAESGKALVTNNTSAGNATSGSADANLVIFNLSGHEIVASNSLLVFVNVLGKWVGVIVDASTGATAAAIGNNVTTNTTTKPSLVVQSQNDARIVNNLSLNSQSGDATVDMNTLAGNATTGNATASANIANISNSQIGLSGWFGVLFINVFGSWMGSFGVDTSAGDPIAESMARAKQPKSHNAAEAMQVFTFKPRTTAARATTNPRPTIITPVSRVTPSPASENGPVPNSVKAANKKTAAVLAAIEKEAVDTGNNTILQRHIDYPLVAASIIMIGASIFSLRRFLF
jgi:hypothetical protein